jgi:glucoamylase
MGTGMQWQRAQNVRLPLLSTAVVVEASGKLVGIEPGALAPPLADGTRVVRSSDLGPAAASQLAEQRQAVSAGPLIPRAGGYADLLRTALIDLQTLTGPNGAAISGWPQPWRYVWPRDAALAAAAFAHNDQLAQSERVLLFLQRVEPETGVFQARYLPDGSGVPDARGEESDATGLVLWAMAQLATYTPATARPALLVRLSRLVELSAKAVYDLTSGPAHLPPASKDYWEVDDSRLSLGTAAPALVGLRAASTLYALMGDHTRADAYEARAAVVQQAIDEAFGPDYPRYRGDDRADASIAFLLPPFTGTARPAIVRAFHAAARSMVRPAGGLAPGAGWKDDGISWTPETALFALTAASIGDATQAHRWLTWLDDHRTDHGALPEKVSSDGSPAGPAPLVFTDAIVTLAVDAQTTSR